MIELINTIKSYFKTKEWFLLALSFLAFIIPISKKFAAFGVGFLFLSIIFDRAKKRFKLSPLLIVLATLYLFHVFWLIGVDDPSLGLKELETKASFFIFPLFAIFSKRLSSKDLQLIFTAFSLGIFVYAVCTMCIGLVNWIERSDYEQMVYWRLAQYFHPTYLGFYSTIAISFVSLLHLNGKVFINKVFHYVFLIVLITYVILLTSKAAILVLLLILFIGFLFSIKKMIHFELKSFLFVFLAFLAGIIGFLNPEFNDKLTEFIKVTNTEIVAESQQEVVPKEVLKVDSLDKNPPVTYAETSTQIRLITWASSIELIQNNWSGVGTGKVTESLMEIYKRLDETLIIEKKFNSHNQYLQFGVEFGVFGLLATILLVFIGIFISIKNRNILLLIVVFYLGFNMLFESFFELQAGTVSVCFLLFVLSITEKKKFKSWSEILE